MFLLAALLGGGDRDREPLNDLFRFGGGLRESESLRRCRRGGGERDSLAAAAPRALLGGVMDGERRVWFRGGVRDRDTDLVKLRPRSRSRSRSFPFPFLGGVRESERGRSSARLLNGERERERDRE